MKSSLSILSAAILMALAGSEANATAPLIQKSAHRNTQPARSAPKHRTAPVGSILYDQTGGMTGLSILAASETVSVYSTQGADDFVVPGGRTWTINAFVVPMDQSSPSSPASGSAQIWSDDGSGYPGATLVCDATDTPMSFVSSEATIRLETPCVLPTGQYWFVFSTIASPSDLYTYWNVNGPVIFQPAQWQNPGGGYFTSCNSWGDLTTCFPSAPSSLIGGDFAFQIIGNASSPVASVSPTALLGDAAPGNIATATLTIGNAGDGDLMWRIDEVSASTPIRFPENPAHVGSQADVTGISILPVGYVSVEGRADVTRTVRRAAPENVRGAWSLPAFGQSLTVSGPVYVGLDVENPGTLLAINPTIGTYLGGGTFAGNDFATEFAVSQPDGDLVAIDTATGILQAIGSTGLGGSVTGIRWDPATDKTYAMTTTSSGSTLYTLDLGTGATTPIGSSGQAFIVDIAIDPQGKLYGVDGFSDTLVTIDKATGASQTIGPLGLDDIFAQSLDFDARTDTLYFAAIDFSEPLAPRGVMYTIDTATGLATEIGTIGTPDEGWLDALAIAVPTGPCATPSDVPWLSEDVTSGTTPPEGATPVTVTMDANGLADGTYAGNVCVYTNDQARRLIAVPVTFTVSAGNDIVFRNGFDNLP